MHSTKIIDVTLRDGEQTPGVAFTLQEKVMIAKMLDEVGVSEIEAGIPAMGEIEQESIRAIIALNLKSTVFTWNRPVLEDIKASLACGLKNIHISVPVSEIQLRYKLNKSRSWILNKLKRAIDYTAGFGCRITVGAEDASRADMEFLLEVAFLAQEMGAVRLRYCDTVGILDPFSTFDAVKKLKQNIKMDIEFHGHNDFGMATANALAAAKAGADYIDTTVAGLGERAGNTDLKEIKRVLKHFLSINGNFDEKTLERLINYVARASGRLALCS
ncbi:homocitrate synthase [Peptococcaceae bacterium]|nr:homocitrate synthase [Peptococcaceae bacterium]MCL0077787.1 homocitrate synthase [Peptococcaceae bacterium]MCL0106408.1 homocitrate synthase [Peptococcaceae bacterium]